MENIFLSSRFCAFGPSGTRYRSRMHSRRQVGIVDGFCKGRVAGGAMGLELSGDAMLLCQCSNANGPSSPAIEFNGFH